MARPKKDTQNVSTRQILKHVEHGDMPFSEASEILVKRYPILTRSILDEVLVELKIGDIEIEEAWNRLSVYVRLEDEDTQKVKINRGDICPSCGFNKSKVTDSRQRPTMLWRKRQCLDCGKRWQTQEIVYKNY